MVENVFYHEDLVINVDHVNRVIHCGHVEGEAFVDINDSTDLSNSDSFNPLNSTEFPTVAPKQFGDKSSDHADTIDSMFIDQDNQFETGYFDGPFRGNVYVRWNSDYYENMARLNNEVPTFEEYISGANLIKIDRYHQLSDIVKHTTSSQIGIINKINKKAYAEIIGCNKLLVDIDCSKFKNIEKFFPGTNEQLVIHNSWLGRVISIQRDVILKFPDGAKLRTSEDIIENYDPIFNSNLSDIIFRASALKGDARDLKSKSTKFITETQHYNAVWLKQLCKQQIIEVFVVKVIISSAKVDWLMFKPDADGSKYGVESPPTIIKGPSVQNLKSVNSTPYLYCYTGDIWYYQLKQGDKAYNLNEEYTISKLLYKIYMKENINHLRFSIKSNKSLKDKETKLSSLKKNKTTTQKNMPKTNLKTESKSKFQSATEKKQDNQNYLTVLTEKILKGSKYMNRKNKSIYHHLQYRCNKEQLFYRSKPVVIHSNRSLKLKSKEKKEVKINDFEKYISYDLNANSVEENKSTIDKNQKIKPSNSKVSKKMNYQQHKINRDMIINYLSNLIAGTWVPVHLILIESLIDVTWQNGITACRIPSISFIPEVFEIDEYDFFPGDFVSIKGFNDNQDLNASNTTFGCVLKATNTERITYVQWFKIDSQSNCSKFGKPEQLGSYDIKHHKKHHYHVGDIVAVAPVCSKTNFPAGCVSSVQPSKGRLSIKWYNEKETLLNPHELFGIVWDLVSDDFFSSSDDTFEISSANLQQELENYKFENTLISFTKQEFQIKPVTDLIQKILKNINAIKKTCCTANEVNREMPEINLKNNDIMKPLVAELMELKTISKDKSINIICENFPLYISRTNELRKLKNFDDLLDNVNSTLPSTSLQDDNFYLNKVSTKRINDEIQILKGTTTEMFDVNIKPDKAVENKFNEFVLNKLSELETSLKNWFKINSINETSVEGTQNEMNEFVGKTLTEQPILKKTEDFNAAEKNIFQQSAPIPEAVHLKIYSNLDNSLSFDGNTYDQFNHDFSVENYKLSLCDPLPTEQLGSFTMVNYNAENHKYIKLFHTMEINRSFNKAWNRDCNLLSTSLPKGIWIKNFEQRVDLFSVMIEGPLDTPYQYTLFFFDIHLTSDYPNQPPLVHYVSLTNDKVNPNLYPEGRVCLSLLGTWIGRGSENWDPKVSNLLQIIVSLQGLILVSEPYFNEAGFEHRRGTNEGLLNSQRYNESIITSLSIAMANLIDNPVKYFEQEIKSYFLENGNKYISTLKFWSSLDDLTFKNYILTNRMSVTEFMSTSDVTKSICDKISKISIKNEANTEVVSSWSEEILPPEIFRSQQENFDEVPYIKFHNKIRLPQFLLAPVSKGFSLTLNKYINLLDKAIRKNEMYD